ncbi:MAG: outer membrane beta-barrel protein [Gemmatimonadales bacterium]|jgi:hypothetical protein
MIRRMLAVSTAVLFVFTALPRSADAQSVYVLAGASVPTSDYGDAFKTGWLAAAGVTFPIGEAGLWAGAEGLYGQNSFDSTESTDLKGKPYSIMAILGYDIPTEGKINPYVWGGAGLMGLRQTSGGESTSDSGFGWQFGAGLALATAGRVSPFVEGRYQSASITPGDSSESATVGLFGIEAGISIGLGSNDDMDGM